MAVNNAINNKVGGSNSGATNTLTVDNASNTASSSALVNITVGGTSSGDAFETFTISGTTNWSQGVDNSDSDAYVIAASTALGTTNVMRSSTAGEIRYALQPAFLSVLGANNNNVTGAGTTYTLGGSTALTEIFDQNADMTTGGTFTAPVTGKYFFSVFYSIGGLTAAMTQVSNRIVTTGDTFAITSLSPGFIRNASNIISVGDGLFVNMTAADTATFTCAVSNGAGDVADILATNTYVSGFLVC